MRSQAPIEETKPAGTLIPVSQQEDLKLREYYQLVSLGEVHPGGMPAAPLIPVLHEDENEKIEHRSPD